MQNRTIKIFEKTIIAYEEAIVFLPYDIDNVYKYLSYRFLENGICWYIEHTFDTSIRYEDINKFTQGRTFLCPAPRHANNIQDVKNLLQQRVDRMKYFVNPWYINVFNYIKNIFK